MARAPQKIGLLNHLGGGNLGDDASLDAVIGNIKSRWPNAELRAFTMNPADTQSRHGIPAFPIRRETWASRPQTAERGETFLSKTKSGAKRYPLISRPLRAIHKVAIRMPRAVVQEFLFLARSFRVIRSVDLLVITGGGQLLDSWGGPWKFPYTIFKWTLLAKVSRAKCYFINVGAGPLRRHLSRWFVKRALLLAGYVSFRDSDSQGLVRQIGFTRKSQVAPDCVYGLEIPAVITDRNGRPDEPVVGVAPMAYCDPRVYWQKNQSVYDCFIRELGLFGSWLIQNRCLLAPFSTDIWFDAPTIEDFRSALTKVTALANARCITREPITAIEVMLSQMASMDYIVTCRFHGVVFAHLLNKPVLAISHHPKVARLMSDLGLSKYCVDIHTCDLNVLTKTFQSVMRDRDEIKSRMSEALANYKVELAAQFDGLFPREAKS